MPHHLELYILIAAAMVATPGAGVLFTVTTSLRLGFRCALSAISGIVLGIVTVAALTVGGMGELLAASPKLFAALQAAGGLFLVYLGVKGFRAAPRSFDAPPEKPARQAESALELAREGLILQATNPVFVIFIFTLFPQFITEGKPFAPQAALLLAIYAALVLLIHGTYAAAAALARRILRGDRAMRLANRAGGLIFIGLGLLVFARILERFL